MNDENVPPRQALEPRAERIPRPIRAVWAVAMITILGWYFRGYVQSLDTYLQPIYERWPALQSLIGSGGS